MKPIIPVMRTALEQIQEILEDHLRVKGVRGLETLCICGWHTAQRLRPEDLHRAHVAEVLDKHMQEREVALLSEVAEEAIDKYADKPYSPGHVIRLLLNRANQLRKDATNGRK